MRCADSKLRRRSRPEELAAGVLNMAIRLVPSGDQGCRLFRWASFLCPLLLQERPALELDSCTSVHLDHTVCGEDAPPWILTRSFCIGFSLDLWSKIVLVMLEVLSFSFTPCRAHYEVASRPESGQKHK